MIRKYNIVYPCLFCIFYYILVLELSLENMIQQCLAWFPEVFHLWIVVVVVVVVVVAIPSGPNKNTNKSPSPPTPLWEAAAAKEHDAFVEANRIVDETTVSAAGSKKEAICPKTDAGASSKWLFFWGFGGYFRVFLDWPKKPEVLGFPLMIYKTYRSLHASLTFTDSNWHPWEGPNDISGSRVLHP